MTIRAAKTQIQLNKLLTRIRDGQHAHGRVILTVPADASQIASKILNDVATVVTVPRGGNIGHIASPSMPGDIYNYVETLIQHIHGEFGVNAMSAQGQIPAGFKSGVAIMRYRELTSRRFNNAERRVGDMHCDAARLSVRLYREMAEQAESPDDVEVVYERWGANHRIPWRRLDLDDQRMRVRAASTNALPRTPAARLEVLQDMLNMQVISPEQFLEKMDFPDMDGLRRQIVAPREYLEGIFERMLETGEWKPPIPEAPLQQGIAMATTYVLIARNAGAPDKRIQLLRKWIAEAKALQAYLATKEAEKAAAIAPPPMGGPMPPGGPIPPMGGPVPPAPPPGMDAAPMPPMPPGAMPPAA